MALFYAGFQEQALRREKLRELSSAEPETITMGFPQPDTKMQRYKVRNPRGTDVHFAIDSFRDGYDLGLINPENGFAVRV